MASVVEKRIALDVIYQVAKKNPTVTIAYRQWVQSQNEVYHRYGEEPDVAKRWRATVKYKPYPDGRPEWGPKYLDRRYAERAEQLYEAYLASLIVGAPGARKVKLGLGLWDP